MDDLGVRAMAATHRTVQAAHRWLRDFPAHWPVLS
jgi:hypothetical protein